MDSISRLPLCSNHLLQQTLRGVCVDSEWVYSVFWRILPRNFPPPKWELGGYLERSKANKRNWILVWEDGFCDFARSSSSRIADIDVAAAADDQAAGNGGQDAGSSCTKYHDSQSRFIDSLHPELFFKMSHEIYNYGEGLMGKVAADNGHKWVYRDPPERDNRLVSFWHNTIDPQPRTWEAQFKSGIQTIVVVAVREGLVQLGSTHQILEDLNFVVLLQRKFNSLQQLASAPPVLQQPPSCAASSSSYSALQSMLSHDRSQSSLERKMRHGRPDEEEPPFRRTLERRLSWSSGTVSESRRSTFSTFSRPCTTTALDLLIHHDNYPFTLPDNDLHLRQQPLPLAQDVQVAADHIKKL